jgi:acetyl-CoA synthetase
MIAYFPAVDICRGSMGLSLPVVEAAIVRRVNSKTIEVIKEPDVQGELALKPGWPSMFRGYLHDGLWQDLATLKIQQQSNDSGTAMTRM